MTILCRQCESWLEDGAVVCPTCGCAVEGVAHPESAPVSAAEPFAETATPEAAATLIEPSLITDSRIADSRPAFGYAMDSDLIGIDGWLILPAIGLAIAPFVLAFGVFTDLHILFGSQYQASLAARPGLAGVLLFEAVNNSVFLLSAIGLNVLFYRKKRRFPIFMMIYLGAQFVLGLADHLMARNFNPHTSWTGVARGLIAAAIWIPYFLQSRRVEVTFVN